MHTLILAMGVVALATPAVAYIGPGLGVGTIAVVLGVIGSIALAIVAVLWYPIKRMLRGGKKAPLAKDKTASGPRANS